MLTRRAVLVTLAIGACGLLFYPFESTVTDAWLITATNTDGHPVAGCRIEQHWEWRVVGLKDLAVETTDVAGHASFPRRTVRASLAQRMTGAWRTSVSTVPLQADRSSSLAATRRTGARSWAFTRSATR
jgi:hypothetical protein